MFSEKIRLLSRKVIEYIVYLPWTVLRSVSFIRSKVISEARSTDACLAVQNPSSMLNWTGAQQMLLRRRHCYITLDCFV